MARIDWLGADAQEAKLGFMWRLWFGVEIVLVLMIAEYFARRSQGLSAFGSDTMQARLTIYAVVIAVGFLLASVIKPLPWLARGLAYGTLYGAPLGAGVYFGAAFLPAFVEIEGDLTGLRMIAAGIATFVGFAWGWGQRNRISLQ